jgi:tRNA threonylcarbamoyladenosine biosynthesis protein TsaE
MAVRTVTTHSEDDTAALGRELAATLSAGDVLLLYGDLGAGKTAFVRGLAEGLGVDRGEVSSPTFTLIQEYRGGRLPLFHVDLYRIEDPREFDELGLDEIAEDGVLAIEWAEKLPARLKPSALDTARADPEALEGSRYVNVRIAHGEGEQREIEITNPPTR